MLAAMFSPRPWGCSVLAVHLGDETLVFPTPVGMFRTRSKNAPKPPSFPHARGDVPVLPICRGMVRKFSPRPWGCSVRADLDGVHHVVFPTPVGMFRVRNLPEKGACSFPHARGDVPTVCAIAGGQSGFSPRPWGCSDRGIMRGAD